MHSPKVTKLKNGATMLYQKRNIKCTSVAAGFLFGKNRDKYAEPTAHFCEHMLFHETEKHNKEELSKMQAKIFSNQNGEVTQTSMFFTFTRANKMLVPALDLCSEMLLSTKFEKKYVESEKGVIKQELIRYNNDANSQNDFTYLRCMRDNHNISTSTLGSEKEIDSITAKDLKKFRDETFISQNFYISFVGDVSFFKAKHLANKMFVQKLKSNPSYPVDKTFEFPYNRNGNLNIEEFPFNKVLGRVSFKLGEIDDKTEQILEMLPRLLNPLKGGDYFETLRNKGLVYGARERARLFPEPVISFEFETSPENVNKIFDEIGNLLKKRRIELYDEEQIEFIKKETEYRKKERSFQKYDAGLRLLTQYLMFKDKYFHHAKRYKKLFNSINPTDIRDFFQKNFSNPDKVYVSILTGEKEPKYYSYEKIQQILTDKKSSKSKTK